MRTDKVILVDRNDIGIGTMDKMEAHRTGQLHRAFSIFIFNAAGDMLLQKRANKKYHSGGLWSNACCSHPMPEEETLAAAHRRLQEELGFDCHLTKAFDFVYRSDLDNNLIEHEFDHVFIGQYDGPISLNTEEASECKHISITELGQCLDASPEMFTTWFSIAFPRLADLVYGSGRVTEQACTLNTSQR